MGTAVIVGAGPGPGRAIAHRFAAEGFGIALISRRTETLERLVDSLADTGVRAEGFAADVTDRPTLVKAFDAVMAPFGPIEVLEYSPAPSKPGVTPNGSTPQRAQG
jgi:NAD(P)-dependent dehydrogenase (short-subunit alcohol dehydrogenase family)